MLPKNIKQLQSQSRELQARRVDRNTVVVESTSNPMANHVVTVRFDDDEHTISTRCTCPWAIHNGVACSHVMAALEYLASLKDRTLSFWLTEEAARRQKHRTFFLRGTNGEGVWITSRPAA
jgi:hypothetical protein